MSFNRHRAQIKCESLLGCQTLDDWRTKQLLFQAYALSKQSAVDLRSSLMEDANDLRYKGLLSLCEAVSSMSNGLFSWAAVRLYYSTFYFLRSSLAAKGYAVIHNKCLYLLRAKEGEKPQKKSSKRYRNDHIGVINIYRDLYASSDKLQSNTVDDLNPYEWLMQKRNQVNYWEREFHDPSSSDFLKVIADRVKAKALDSLVTLYIEDKDYIYCFQSDHACLALPIKRAILTSSDLCSAGASLIVTKKKLSFLKSC
jgi:hypothetical protein